MAAAILSGCSALPGDAKDEGDTLRSTIGPEGGELTGAAFSKLEGVHVVIPAGALSAPTELQVKLADVGTPLPAAAHSAALPSRSFLQA